MIEPGISPSIVVPTEEVLEMLAENADPIGSEPTDPELCLMAATTYVLLAQAALNYSWRRLIYDGAVASLCEPVAELLDLRIPEARAALYLLMRYKWVQRDRKRLDFPRFMSHLQPHDFFARVPVRDIARRRRMRSELPAMLAQARPAALEAYAEWSAAVFWAPPAFHLLRGSWQPGGTAIAARPPEALAAPPLGTAWSELT